MNRDPVGPLDQRLYHRAAEERAQPARARPPDDDLGDVGAPGIAQQFARHVAAGQTLDPAVELPRQGDRLFDPVAGRTGGTARRLHMHRHPGRAELVGEAPAMAHQGRPEIAGADADQDALPRRPRPVDGVGLHVADHLLVDLLGHAAQGEFAQRGEVAGAEEPLQRRAGHLRHVDLALVQPVDELGRSQVDQLDLVGALEHPVRQGFLHPHAGDAGDHVVQAVEMLDVEGGLHVDAGLEQLLHVLPALRVPTVGRVGVGELVDQDQGRAAGERGVDVEFLQQVSAIEDRAARQQFEALDQGLGLLATVRLGQTDHHVGPAVAQPPRSLQHGVGLPDPRRHAEIDLEATAPLARRRGEQGVGMWTAGFGRFAHRLIISWINRRRAGPAPGSAPARSPGARR